MINATLNFFINFLTISFEVLLVDLINTRPPTRSGNGVLVASLRPHLGMPLGYANPSISINVGVNL